MERYTIAVTTSVDKTARVWDLATQTELGVFTGHSGIINGVAVGTLNGRPVAATTSFDRTAQIWDLSSIVPYEILRFAEQPPEAIAMSGNRVVVGFGPDIAVYETDLP